MNEIIFVTQRSDLRTLMALEFHENGKKDFVSTEAENYIQRLTESQKQLLKSNRVRINQLTAFIVFGDGVIERPTGGTYVTQDMEYQDIIRPNSSLALFYKHSGEKIELVFYTRFLTASYAIKNEYANEVKAACKELDVGKNINFNKQKIFNMMHKLYPVTNLDPVTRVPPEGHTYFFYVKSVDGGQESADLTCPYISVRNASDTHSAPFIGPGNTIHGIIDTRGCWMLLRNFLWEYPNENVGNTYVELAKLYLIYKKTGGYQITIPASNPPKTVRMKIYDLLQKNLSESEVYVETQNYSYMVFLRLFTGLHCNRYLKFSNPQQNRNNVVLDIANTPNTFKTDLLVDIDDYWKGENLEFVSSPLQGEKQKILGYNASRKVIYLERGVGVTPPPGTKFVIDNCWSSNPRPKWGPNIFGHTFGYNKPWATVFGFKRTDGFTSDPGDAFKFQ